MHRITRFLKARAAEALMLLLCALILIMFLLPAGLFG